MFSSPAFVSFISSTVFQSKSEKLLTSQLTGLIKDGNSTSKDGTCTELFMQIQANEEFALSSEEPLCLCYSGFSESSLAGGQELTALFICTDSRVLREERGGVAAEGLSNRFEWSGWLVPQFAVSFLARLCWVASTGAVRCGRGVWKRPVSCAII